MEVYAIRCVRYLGQQPLASQVDGASLYRQAYVITIYTLRTLMQFLYHKKPTNLEGQILYPLSELRNRFPATYEVEHRKYVGREELLTQPIPHLDCKWEDVVFGSPISPLFIYEAMIEAGLTPDPSLSWYRIPISSVQESTLAIYHYPNRDTGDFSIRPEDVSVISVSEYHEITKVPEQTIEYYSSMKELREKPFLFHLVPHVFIKGQVDISNSDTIQWP